MVSCVSIEPHPLLHLPYPALYPPFIKAFVRPHPFTKTSAPFSLPGWGSTTKRMHKDTCHLALEGPPLIYLTAALCLGGKTHPSLSQFSLITGQPYQEDFFSVCLTRLGRHNKKEHLLITTNSNLPPYYSPPKDPPFLRAEWWGCKHYI
jgi:hypothetical protein